MAEELVATTPETPEPAGMDMDSAVADIASAMNFDEPAEKTEAVDTGEKAAGEDKEPLPTAALSSDAKTPGTDPASPEASTAAPIEAPDTWTPAAKAEWAKVSPTVQAEIQKREADISRYVGETKPKVEVADGLDKMLAPYQGLFQQYKVNPWNHIDGLLKAHTALMFGNPQQKAHMAFALLKDAGIDPGKLSGGNPLEAVSQPNQEVVALRARLAELESGVTSVTSELSAQRSAEREAQVVAFAEDPAHPHFYKVWQDVHRLLDTKMCKTLDEAYEKAVWGNPLVRAEEITRLNGEKQKQAEESRKKQLDSSRHAASVNTRGRANGSGAAATPTNWEDTLTDTLADINSRT